MTKDKNDMTIQINEMSDRSKIVEADLKKELEDNQQMIRTYKEKSEKQESELTELKSKIAVLKVDLEDEKKVSNKNDIFLLDGSVTSKKFISTKHLPRLVVMQVYMCTHSQRGTWICLILFKLDKD